MVPNPALNLAPFSRWTLRDKASQLRWVAVFSQPNIYMEILG
jgi:hypothetical protein